MKYGESTRKLFDSNIAQIRYQGVSLQWFCNNSIICPGQWYVSEIPPA
jgi:hypothetical protein